LRGPCQCLALWCMDRAFVPVAWWIIETQIDSTRTSTQSAISTPSVPKLEGPTIKVEHTSQSKCPGALMEPIAQGLRVESKLFQPSPWLCQIQQRFRLYGKGARSRSCGIKSYQAFWARTWRDSDNEEKGAAVPLAHRHRHTHTLLTQMMTGLGNRTPNPTHNRRFRA